MCEEQGEKVLQKSVRWSKDGLDEGNFFIYGWEPFGYRPKMGGYLGVFNHVLGAGNHEFDCAERGRNELVTSRV